MAKRIAIYTILFSFVIFFVLPLILMLMTSFKNLDEIQKFGIFSFPKSFSLLAWKKAWSEACIGINCHGLNGYFINSISFVLPAVFFSTFIGALNGHILAKWKFPGSEIFFGLLLLGCFIPLQSIIIPLARILYFLDLQNSTWGLILVHVIYGVSFTTLYFRNYYVDFPPEILLAAKMDGAYFHTIFFRIVLPLSLPIIMVSVIWQFTHIWNDYLFGVILSSGENRPITVALNNLVNSTTSVREYNVDMAAAMISSLPTLIIYILAGKFFIRGTLSGSLK